MNKEGEAYGKNGLHAVWSFSFRHSKTAPNRLHWGSLSHSGVSHSGLRGPGKYDRPLTIQ